jgi:hypothetical protein
MHDLPAIVALYNELDLVLEGQRAEADSTGNTVRAQLIEAKQVLNDQAYFVLCWGQLEAVIDIKCREAIRRRKSQPLWENRRAWDLYNPDDKRLSGLSFEERTALVLDGGAGPGSAWAKVMQYYELRNKIAHGNLNSTHLELNEIAQQFYVIHGQLTT